MKRWSTLIADRANRFEVRIPSGLNSRRALDGVPRAAGLEAGQAVREDLGKHGDDAVGQIDARAAMAGRAVERRSGRTKCDTSAMWTARLQWPCSSRDSEMASSKSRAVAGSIVTVGRSRRSSRVADLGFVEQLGLLAGLVEGLLLEGVGDVEGADDRQACRPPAARAGRGSR